MKEKCATTGELEANTEVDPREPQAIICGGSVIDKVLFCASSACLKSTVA